MKGYLEHEMLTLFFFILLWLVEFVAQEFKKQKRKIFYGEPAGIHNIYDVEDHIVDPSTSGSTPCQCMLSL